LKSPFALSFSLESPFYTIFFSLYIFACHVSAILDVL
jgi:hypothetical protein